MTIYTLSPGRITSWKGMSAQIGPLPSPFELHTAILAPMFFFPVVFSLLLDRQTDDLFRSHSALDVLTLHKLRFVY